MPSKSSSRPISSVFLPGKTNESTPTFSRAVPIKRRPLIRGQLFGPVLQQLVLVLADVGQTQAIDIVECRAKADRVGNVRRPRFRTLRAGGGE